MTICSTPLLLPSTNKVPLEGATLATQLLQTLKRHKFIPGDLRYLLVWLRLMQQQLLLFPNTGSYSHSYLFGGLLPSECCQDLGFISDRVVLELVHQACYSGSLFEENCTTRLFLVRSSSHQEPLEALAY